MRKYIIPFAGVLLLFCSTFAQTPRTDREEEGLKGKVRSINAQATKLSKDGQLVPDTNKLTYTESYDEQGNLTARTIFDYRGNISQKSVYTLIDGDRTARIEHFRHEYDPPPAMAPPPQGEQKPHDPRFDIKYKFKYEGNKMERTLFYNDGSQGNRIVTTFDEKGNEIRRELYTRDGRLNYAKTSVYDDKGVQTGATFYRPDGSVSEKYKYTDQEIDWRGNWIKRKVWISRSESGDFEPYQIALRTISYFDDKASEAMATSARPGADKPLVIRVSTGVLADRAIKKVNPVYPREAAEAGVWGEVLVEVSVDEQGNVASVEGVSGDRLLVDAAIAAVSQWKFEPTKLGGKPVRVIGRLRFKFNR